MITRPTVLILGAGSNVEYGFPTGDQLRMAIINGLNEPRIQNYFEEHTDHVRHDLLQFASDFRQSSESIDRFLEQNPSYKKLGYEAIAYFLTRYEQDADLYRTDTPRWYDYLWRKLDDGHEKSPDTQKLSIITFNYDRSLEQYLAMALKQNYHADDATIGESLRRLEFIHLYGTIGGQPFMDQRTIPFGHASHLKASASTIKIIERSTDDKVSDAFTAAHTAISKAEYIFILGFGFDWLNCERLAIKEHFRFPTKRRIFATAYGMGERSMDDACKLMQLGRTQCIMTNGDCLDLFGNVQALGTT